MAKKAPSKKRKLTDPQKEFMVQCLARYMSPQEAADALSEQYGVTITPQSAQHYDPNKWAGRTLSARLKKLFERAREDYLKDAQKHIPIANKTVRLQKLTDQLKKFERQGNSMGVMRVLEQVAKEVGGSFTNLRQHTGRGGGPIETMNTNLHLDAMSDDEIRTRMAEILAPPKKEQPS